MELTKNEFDRFEKDLHKLLDVKFGHSDKTMGRLNTKMDSLVKVQESTAVDIAKINAKAEKAHERIDANDNRVEKVERIINGVDDKPGVLDDVRELKTSRRTVMKYVQRFFLAIITLIVMSVGGYILSKVFGL